MASSLPRMSGESQMRLSGFWPGSSTGCCAARAPSSVSTSLYPRPRLFSCCNRLSCMHTRAPACQKSAVGVGRPEGPKPQKQGTLAATKEATQLTRRLMPTQDVQQKHCASGCLNVFASGSL